MKKLTNTEINMQILKILINKLKPSQVADCIFLSKNHHEICKGIHEAHDKDMVARFALRRSQNEQGAIK